MEDFILDNLTAAEIAEKCDNLIITLHFANETEKHFFAEKDFLEKLKKELDVKSIDFGEGWDYGEKANSHNNAPIAGGSS